MLNLSGLDPLVMILLILAISGVISYGLTQFLKSFILKWDETHHDCWWFNSVVRLIAIAVGCGIGFMLVHTTLGLMIGLCGGILNTTIVAVIKSRLSSIQLPDQIPHSTDTTVEPPTSGTVG